MKELVKKYQCCGCVADGEGCYEKEDWGIGCKKHCAGTRANNNVGRFLLGVPKGFCRFGICEESKTSVFENITQQSQDYAYDKFNVPVWKFLDGDMCFVRGLKPRLNEPFLHIIANMTRKDFETINCLEINKEDIEEMD